MVLVYAIKFCNATEPGRLSASDVIVPYSGKKGTGIQWKWRNIVIATKIGEKILLPTTSRPEAVDFRIRTLRYVRRQMYGLKN